MTSDPGMPDSIIDAQVRRLLDIVDGWRQEQCDALVIAAQQEAREVIRQAYRSARNNLHQDIQQTRQQTSDTLAAARAKQHTLMMQQRHRAASDFLELCWSSLAETLQARWQQPGERRAWVEKIVSKALAVVPAKHWLVEHPQDWSAGEQQQVATQVEAQSGKRPEFAIVSELTAGIRISTDGAIIDGSLHGLLADRDGIESGILAHCPDHLIFKSG
jgi:vacuolar-type H+-ATPase subunit H